LEISFINKELRSICENKDEAINRFGEGITFQIQARLSDIFAASNIDELFVGNPHKTGEFPFMNYTIDLTKGFRLEFCANDMEKSYLENGELDWSKISRIKIVNIQYYHE